MAKRFICPRCQHIGKPAGKKRGSAKVELAGWFLLFPLGIPYTLWRIFSKIPVCKSCSHDMLIDESSVVGQRLIAKIYEDIAPSLPEAALAQPEKIAPTREKKPWRPEHDPNQF